jgi:hypothetical protein
MLIIALFLVLHAAGLAAWAVRDILRSLPRSNRVWF